jgi:peroxiredoxin
MVVTASLMRPLGTRAIPFSLPDTEGNQVSLDDFKDAPALLIAFMCNHCPYVKHVLPTLVPLIRDLKRQGVAAVGISANDVTQYPEDHPDRMAEVAREKGFTFPYVYDETQETAKAYGATCTPDFFLYDRKRSLVYRGQMDDSRPGNGLPVTGTDLKAAVTAVLAGSLVSAEQKPSMGCNIKWKKGNEPEPMD